jgi:hypothetical protein
MITFETGEVTNKNASVTFGADPDEAHAAHAARDEAGNVHVTVDTLEPEHGDEIVLTLHQEHDARYHGTVEVREGKAVFKGN